LSLIVKHNKASYIGELLGRKRMEENLKIVSTYKPNLNSSLVLSFKEIHSIRGASGADSNEIQFKKGC
jgi:hypothetical protein